MPRACAPSSRRWQLPLSSGGGRSCRPGCLRAGGAWPPPQVSRPPPPSLAACRLTGVGDACHSCALPTPAAARHWRYEAARQVRRDQLLRTALAAWREAAEDTAGTLASFWARWQVQAVQSRALLAWRQVAAAQRSARELQGMADVHRTRQLKAAGLAAFAGATAAARTARECSASPPFDAHAGPRTQQRAQQHVQQQQRQQQQRLPAPPSAPQAQQAQPRGFTTRTTIIISQPASQCPAQLAVAASASSCAGASGSTTNWRAAAAYWQERHARLAQQPPLAQQQAVAVHPPAGVGPHTATTLSELRMRWAQENRHQQ